MPYVRTAPSICTVIAEKINMNVSRCRPKIFPIQNPPFEKRSTPMSTFRLNYFVGYSAIQRTFDLVLPSLTLVFIRCPAIESHMRLAGRPSNTSSYAVRREPYIEMRGRNWEKKIAGTILFSLPAFLRKETFNPLCRQLYNFN